MQIGTLVRHVDLQNPNYLFVIIDTKDYPYITVKFVKKFENFPADFITQFQKECLIKVDDKLLNILFA